MHRADRALYAAKQAGRNRTVLDGDAYAEAVDEPEELRLARTMASPRACARTLVAALAAGRGAGRRRRPPHRPAAADRRPLRAGRPVHDIGKVALPEGLLLKRGPLDPNEWSLMRAHSEVGEQMAREACVLEAVAEIVRHHHERFDGSGYPDGLAGDAIPVEARIVAACDAYSAMTDRAAVPARPHPGGRDRRAAPLGGQPPRPRGRRGADRGARRAAGRGSAPLRHLGRVGRSAPGGAQAAAATPHQRIAASARPCVQRTRSSTGTYSSMVWPHAMLRGP